MSGGLLRSRPRSHLAKVSPAIAVAIGLFVSDQPFIEANPSPEADPGSAPTIADTTGQRAWIAADLELLNRLDSIEELDAHLARAVDDALPAEHHAALHMAYVDRLSRERPTQFLPELRQQAMAGIHERVERSLRFVIDHLAETSHTPAAYTALTRHYGMTDPKQQLELLEELSARFPDTAEGAEAKNTLTQARIAARINASSHEVWSTADSVAIRLSGRHDGVFVVRIWRMDDEHALDWWGRGARREIDPTYRAIEVQARKVAGEKWQLIDTTLAFHLPAGSYACRAEAGSRSGETATFRVTDHRLLHHSEGDSVLVTAISRMATPVPGVRVEVYEAVPFDPWSHGAFELLPIGSWKTGEDGKAVLRPSPSPEPDGRSPRRLMLVSRARDHFDVAWQSVGRFEQWSRSVLWTDRTVYRPGELVVFQLASFHRRLQSSSRDTVYMRAGMRTASGPRSHAGWDTVLTLNELGSADGVFAIPLDAVDGELSITAGWLGDRGGIHQIGEAHPKIRALDRPDWDFQVELRQVEVLLGDSLIIEVQARTAQGVPLRRAGVSVAVSEVEMRRSYDLHNQPLSQGWYGPANPSPASCTTRWRAVHDAAVSHAAALDEAGRASITIPGLAPPDSRAAQYVNQELMISGVILEVSVDDGSGGQRSRRIEVPIFPGRAWCTVPRDPTGSVETRVQDGVAVRRIGNDNRPAPGPVYFRWVKRAPDRVHDRYVETAIDSGMVMTHGNAFVHLSPPIVSPDELMLDVWADPGAWTATRIGRPPEMDLPTTAIGFHRCIDHQTPPGHWIAVDRLQYSVGDTAHVLLSPTLRTLPGIMSAGYGHESYLLRGERGDSVVSIPIRPEHLPSIFVEWKRVFGADGCGFPRDGATRDRIVVEPSSRLLSLEIGTDRDRYAPGDTIEVRVKTTDANGKPVGALVSVGAVDEAIYSIAADDFDIARELYQLTRSDNVIVTSCGGWGGESRSADLPARAALRPTAFWRPALATDSITGIATFRAVLPEDLARWRITARAFDREGRVGQARGSFFTEAPLGVRPRLPRFVRIGDRFDFGVWVDNQHAEALACEVSWQSACLSATSDTRVKVTAGPDASARASFAAVASRAGVDSISIVARAGKLRDSMRFPLTVLGPERNHRNPEGLAYSLEMILDGVRSTLSDTTIGDPCGWREDVLRLFLALESGQRLLAGHHLLVDGGTELPEQVLPGSQRRLEFHERAVFEPQSAGFAVRQAHQTARFLGDLTRAERQGWRVGEVHVRARLLDWLTGVAASPLLTGDQRVEVIAELAAMDVITEEAIQMAVNSREALSPGGCALLARTLLRTRPAEAADLLASAIGQGRVSQDSTYAHYEIGRDTRLDRSFSSVRSASEVLQSIVAVGIESPLAQPLANAIALHRDAGAWALDDDTADAVRALVAYAEWKSVQRGDEALDRLAVAPASTLGLERRVSVTRSGATVDDHRRSHGTPDTVVCATGDMVSVDLRVRASVPIRGLEVFDPMPAGCTEALNETYPDAWSSAIHVRDSHVQIVPSGRETSPGEVAVSHDLFVERGGLFHVPPARVHLRHQPALWAESAPLVLLVKSESFR